MAMTSENKGLGLAEHRAQCHLHLSPAGHGLTALPVLLMPWATFKVTQSQNSRGGHRCLPHFIQGQNRASPEGFGRGRAGLRARNCSGHVRDVASALLPPTTRGRHPALRFTAENMETDLTCLRGATEDGADTRREPRSG